MSSLPMPMPPKEDHYYEILCTSWLASQLFLSDVAGRSFPVDTKIWEVVAARDGSIVSRTPVEMAEGRPVGIKPKQHRQRRIRKETPNVRKNTRRSSH